MATAILVEFANLCEHFVSYYVSASASLGPRLTKSLELFPDNPAAVSTSGMVDADCTDVNRSKIVAKMNCSGKGWVVTEGQSYAKSGIAAMFWTASGIAFCDRDGSGSDPMAPLPHAVSRARLSAG
jgi:hypothetical protein